MIPAILLAIVADLISALILSIVLGSLKKKVDIAVRHNDPGMLPAGFQNSLTQPGVPPREDWLNKVRNSPAIGRSGQFTLKLSAIIGMLSGVIWFFQSGG